MHRSARRTAKQLPYSASASCQRPGVSGAPLLLRSRAAPVGKPGRRGRVLCQRPWPPDARRPPAAGVRSSHFAVPPSKNAARGAHTMPAPLCSCTCGRQVFDAYVRRGQSARLSLPGGSVHLARKVACTERFLRRRPDMAEDLKRHLLMGKQKGRGSGPWARALQILAQNVERPPADVLGFLCGSPMTAASADTMPTSVTALPTTEMSLTAPKTFKSSSCDAESSRAATPSRNWQSCALTQKA